MEQLISPHQPESDNATSLVSLIALFYTQGNTAMAKQLLKMLHDRG